MTSKNACSELQGCPDDLQPARFDPAPAGTPYCRIMHIGSTVSLHCHVWRQQIAWYVVITLPGGRKYIAARGMAEREADPVDDTPGNHLMSAAYEAYRALGE